MNINNIDPKKLSGLIGAVSKKIGVPPEKLQKDLEEGRFDSAVKAMNDPKLVEKMMSTPQAKALYQKLSGEK